MYNMREVEEFALIIKQALTAIYEQQNSKLPIETADENKAFQIVVEYLRGGRNADQNTITALKIVKNLISKWKQMHQMQNTASAVGSVFSNTGVTTNVSLGSGVSSGGLFGNVGGHIEDDSFISLPVNEVVVNNMPEIVNQEIPKEDSYTTKTTYEKEIKPEITVDNVEEFYEPALDSVFKPLIDENRFILDFIINKDGKFEYRVKEKDK